MSGYGYFKLPEVDTVTQIKLGPVAFLSYGKYYFEFNLNPRR